MIENNKIASLKARIWPDSNSFHFPEQQHSDKPLTGVCFSGGGNRAYSAAIGQLRALHHLNLLPKCDYLSAVSGGAWAATAFTYATQSANSLLGPLIINPGDLTINTLKYRKTYYLGNAASQNLFEQFHQDLKTLPLHEVWINTVAQIYLEPYGLNQPQYTFTENQKSLSEIIKNNPSLSPSLFYQSQRSPYLITSGTLLWPDHHVALKDRLLFQFTPDYVGILNKKALSADKLFFFKIHRDFGGGFLQTFAFNASKPIEAINTTTPFAITQAAQKPFTLADMVGSSSAFFASAAEDLAITRNLIPKFNYWPIETQQKQKAAPSLIGDGGNLENYGILPLLQRQVDHIIVFINSETAINQPHQNPDGEWHGIDVYLPPLFGEHSEFWKAHDGKPTTQIFDRELLTELLEQFQHCINQGASVAALTHWPVKENKDFQIDSRRPDGSPYQVKILWCYNTPVKQWQEQLPQPLQSALEKKAEGPFPNFPNYSTIDANFDLFNVDTWNDWGGLSCQQVNLLAHFSSWNVLQQKARLFYLFNLGEKINASSGQIKRNRCLTSSRGD